MYNSMLRNSISPTLLNAGIRVNVIPNKAEANLNCRLLPSERVENFVEELKRVIADDGIKVTYEKELVPEPPASSFDNELWHTIAKVANEMYPGAETVPFMSTGATDSKMLRAKGIQAYGLLPFPADESEITLMHGNDERIGLERLRMGVQFLYAITRELTK